MVGQTRPITKVRFGPICDRQLLCGMGGESNRDKENRFDYEYMTDEKV